MVATICCMWETVFRVFVPRKSAAKSRKRAWNWWSFFVLNSSNVSPFLSGEIGPDFDGVLFLHLVAKRDFVLCFSFLLAVSLKLTVFLCSPNAFKPCAVGMPDEEENRAEIDHATKVSTSLCQFVGVDLIFRRKLFAGFGKCVGAHICQRNERFDQRSRTGRLGLSCARRPATARVRERLFISC